jgi:glycosyltransferase involved in cell wall biosynthesis
MTASEKTRPALEAKKLSAPASGERADRWIPPGGKPKVVVVMPAYNAAKTLRITYQDIPRHRVDGIILVDDGSTDETLAIARELNLMVFVHARNFGYGANQKTCYTEALKEGAGIVVMLHPDYQYDPTLLPEIVAPIESGEADIVLGSRFLLGSVMKQGMPWWKYISNRFLTKIENGVLGLRLSEYHTGYRAYSREALEELPYLLNSDKFVFDQEILVQAADRGLRIREVPVPTKYFPEASSAGFIASCRYGLSILFLLGRYELHRTGLWKQKQFESLRARYRRLE